MVNTRPLGCSAIGFHFAPATFRSLSRTLTVEGEARTFYDITGEDATLFHHAAGPDAESMGPQYWQQATTWFDSVWSTIAFERA